MGRLILSVCVLTSAAAAGGHQSAYRSLVTMGAIAAVDRGPDPGEVAHVGARRRGTDAADAVWSAHTQAREGRVLVAVPASRGGSLWTRVFASLTPSLRATRSAFDSPDSVDVSTRVAVSSAAFSALAVAPAVR